MDWKEKTACIAIKAEAAQASQLWERLQSWKPALGAWETTGNWDYLTWIEAANLEELHRWAMELRGWPGVGHTSSHQVWAGSKNGKSWWDDQAGVWVWGRWNGKSGSSDPVKQGWATSSFSLPGEWDSLFWVQAPDWDQVWKKTWSLRQDGWETSTQVPMRRWWNQAKLKNWS